MGDVCDLLCLDLPAAEALRARRLERGLIDGVAQIAAALGDPTRVELAVALRGGQELCVCDLSWVVERADKVVSHHLGKMRAAGVVDSRREGRMVMYRLTSRGAALLTALLADEVLA
jgi:DNA-binding transcriptional ArsR family regulator